MNTFGLMYIYKIPHPTITDHFSNIHELIQKLTTYQATESITTNIRESVAIETQSKL